MGRGTVAGSGEGKVRQDPPSAGGLVNRRRVATWVAVAVAVLALARCGGDVVALGRTDAAQSFQTFRNGSFLFTVTDLAYGVQEIPVDAAAKSRGVSAYKTKNGQFIVFYATADYLLFSGPLQAAMDLGHWPSQDWFVLQSPSLIWPADSSWCVATEVDFDSTLIAGDNHLIDAVLDAEDLEATPIEPGDCLDSRGDTVNV
jgi:hypothetical protein